MRSSGAHIPNATVTVNIQVVAVLSGWGLKWICSRGELSAPLRGTCSMNKKWTFVALRYWDFWGVCYHHSTNPFWLIHCWLITSQTSGILSRGCLWTLYFSAMHSKNTFLNFTLYSHIIWNEYSFKERNNQFSDSMSWCWICWSHPLLPFLLMCLTFLYFRNVFTFSVPLCLVPGSL